MAKFICGGSGISSGMVGNALECSCLCSSTVNVAGTCKRKFSLVCVVFFVLSLYLQESSGQDKQTESFSRNSSLNRELPSPISSQYYWLFSCCDHFLFSNAFNTSNSENYYNSTTGASKSSSGECNNANAAFNTNKQENYEDLNYEPTIHIASFTFTLQSQPREGLCTSVSQTRVVVNINENPDNTTPTILRKNGYLTIEREHYAPDEFCVDKLNETHMEVLVCRMDCKNRLCIRKCCNPYEMISFGVLSNGKWEKDQVGCKIPSSPLIMSSSEPGGLFKPPIYHDYSNKLSLQELKQMRMPHFIETTTKGIKVQCPYNMTTLFPFSEAVSETISKALNRQYNHMEFKLRKDGQLLYRHLNGRCESQEELFCMDRLQNYGENIDEENGSKKDPNPTHDMVIVTCTVKPPKSPSSHYYISKIFGPLMLCASIFPFMTTVVYILLWKKQTVHGWTIVSTSTSLLLMYIFIGTSHVIREMYGQEAHDTIGCVVVAVAAHYFFLSTFSWLTVMCCDLWWTFRSLTPVNRRSKGIKRFVKYALFGWGVPSVFIIASLIVHNVLGEDCNTYVIVPAYGRESCYLTGRAQGVYLYYPAVILLSINLIFFSVTCMKLYQYRESCQMASKTDMKECKLFCVMGVTWIFEIVSWAIDGLGLYWYWAIFDVINILRAAAVFVIYVCKKDVLNSLGEAYPVLRKNIVRGRRSVNSQVINKDGFTTTTLLVANNSRNASANPSKNNSLEDVSQL